MEANIKKYHQLLSDLKRFQNQSDNVNLDEFNSWKEKIITNLTGNYKIRFTNLVFYEEYEEANYFSNDDDLPF